MDKASSDQLHLCPVIESDTLTNNNWVNTFRKYWRYIDDNPGCTIGWVTSLRPVRISTPVDSSIVAMLELLALLQLSDSYCGGVLNHASIVGAPGGQLKPYS